MIPDGALRTVTEDEAKGLIMNSILEDDATSNGCDEEESHIGKHRKRTDSLFRVKDRP